MIFAFIDVLVIIFLILLIVWILGFTGVIAVPLGIIYTLLVISLIILVIWSVLRFCSHLCCGRTQPVYNRDIWGRRNAVVTPVAAV